MDRLRQHFLFLLLLLFGSQAVADDLGVLSIASGKASVSNIDGYDKSSYYRWDGVFFFTPRWGVNVFITGYEDFVPSTSPSATTTSPVTLNLDTKGLGLTHRWPLYPHFQPFIRAEFLDWQLEANAFARRVGKDRGKSLGVALGFDLPSRNALGLRAEAIRYSDISGADIDQLSVGLTIRF